MSWVRSDTDGILDKCAECGGWAGWRPSVNGDGPKWAASCTACPNQTDFVATKFDAAVSWNKAQREKSNTGSRRPGEPEANEGPVR